MPPRGRPAPDQSERDRAIAERSRTVLIEAGAGTGKTAILVDRLVAMVAPRDGEAASPIERLAAITFTRKAAGELRLRIRERLLEELADPGVSAARERWLRDALAGLDTAYVGTIHSFADRLLRLRPVEAELSPSYEIVENEEELVRETYELLVHGAQNQTLTAELAGMSAAGRALEATRTVLFALDAGLRAQSFEREWDTLYGLDALVAGFVAARDVLPPDADVVEFDRASFQAAVDEILTVAGSVQGSSRGERWISRLCTVVRRVRDEHEPYLILREVRRHLDAYPRNPTKRDAFANDAHAWKVWKQLREGEDDQEPLVNSLCAPPNRWLATRLVRLFPVVVELYEKVKGRRRALDQLDLLLKLRDLLRDDQDVRAEFQQMFDHVFVDEFQDTDPLQAEIVLFLCEDDARAARWREVHLRAGALTLVGDPKQSIYRFRRADVAMYDQVREVVKASDSLEITLSANFRSSEPLIEWLNDRFDHVLGVAPHDQRFERATGRVYNRHLLPGRDGDAASSIHVLPFEFQDGAKHGVDDYRKLEGRALARYLHWLVEASDLLVTDPITRERRRPRFGDIAILAVSTWRLSLLFPWLDAAGIPWSARGGTLFLADPLHRQLLLGLRALSDRDDGVAEAALLRPPFFALDLDDLAHERDARRTDGASDNENLRHVHGARDLIRDLRRRRFERPPGVTARELLDRTAFARVVALGANGAERLARLREICHVLAEIAARDGLDYDAATSYVRDWVENPVQLDPPHPVGAEAVQVLTVHQAKGLEFPVVVLWDGKGQWDTRVQPAPWRMERDGRGWLMSLDGLTCEEPPTLALRQTEKSYLDWERRRVVYVACTRARDLLVIPRAATTGGKERDKLVCATLLDGAPAEVVHELECYRDGSEAAWVRAIPAAPLPLPYDAAPVEREVAARWESAAKDAARPRFRPASVTGELRAAPRTPPEVVAAGSALDVVRDDASPADVSNLETDAAAAKPATPKRRDGRFGAVFGSTVHHAIGLCVHDHALDAAEAIRRAAHRFGLVEHLDEAVADVRRTLDTLRSEGLFRRPGPDLQLEYPVAGVLEDGTLMSGYVDLVAIRGDDVVVVDFKSDSPPTGPVEMVYPRYAAQARAYARLLIESAAGRNITPMLFFTGDGAVHPCAR